jgi:hypothetical protein
LGAGALTGPVDITCGDGDDEVTGGGVGEGLSTWNAMNPATSATGRAMKVAMRPAERAVWSLLTGG